MLRFVLALALFSAAVFAHPFLPLVRPQLNWDERVVGGTNARDGQAPYQVSLRPGHLPSFHFCGGSIIGDYWVLTAAHCTIDKGPGEVLVVVGSVFNNPTGKTHRVRQVINHEHYDGNEILNDVALLEVMDSFVYGPTVQAVGLHTSPVPGESLAIFTGWGQMSVRLFSVIC
jgi:secreted trypsin-like serine protease